ncbi:MAG: nitroreductase family protein, partial [Pseudomonadota bacterium]|nr:nitroreductase family protein [Pseudomonadota bacterium]
MQQALQLIEQRVSINRFDPDHTLSQQEIEQLVRLATRAPTAF